MAEDVIVYSTQTCPFCTMAKDFLKQHNIPFKDIDVGANQEGFKEMLQKSGQTSVPVIDVKGQIVVGFNEAVLKQALNL